LEKPPGVIAAGWSCRSLIVDRYPEHRPAAQGRKRTGGSSAAEGKAKGGKNARNRKRRKTLSRPAAEKTKQREKNGLLGTR
jgi:hypothetical protein